MNTVSYNQRLRMNLGFFLGNVVSVFGFVFVFVFVFFGGRRACTVAVFIS